MKLDYITRERERDSGRQEVWREGNIDDGRKQEANSQRKPRHQLLQMLTEVYKDIYRGRRQQSMPLKGGSIFRTYISSRHENRNKVEIK